MPDLTLSNILLTLFLIAIFIGFLIFVHYTLTQKIDKKKAERSNKAACKKVLNEHKKRLYTDYFWSNHMRFAWIMLFLLFFIALGLAIGDTISLAISIILMVLTYFFIRFAIKSYKEFPDKAAARLKKFETEVEDAIKNEISFKGDNIQLFSNKDDSFDTEPIIFSFPTSISTIPFPPLEKNAKKQPINTRKLEYLVLSREYFSICKNAATFNLLNPDRGGKCAELPGRAGECHEHYYSQMRNVEYNNEKQAIRIIYYDERDDVEFACNKGAAKPAMKALQEKLRLTERQRLHKIDEHEKYEKIVQRRESGHKNLESEEDEN